MTASPRWVLAYLSREEVQALQKAAGEKAVDRSGWRGLLDEVGQISTFGRGRASPSRPHHGLPSVLVYFIVH